MNKASAVAIGVTLTSLVLAASSASAQEVEWRLVIPANPGQPLYDLTAELIADEVEARSDGRMTIDLFTETAMGSGPEIVQNLRAGAVEMHWQAFAITASYVPAFEFTSLPFIFADRGHLDRFLDTEGGQQMVAAAEDYGVYIMDPSLTGFRFPVSSSTLFRAPEDFEGVRVRTMENNIQVDTMSALGANPVVLPYGEVYQSLQSGLVAGFYNDRTAFEYLSIHEVAPYLTELPLFSLGLSMAVSKRALDALPDDLNAIVRETIAEGAPVVMDALWAFNIEEEDWKGELFEEHVAVDDIGPFVEAVAPMYEAFVAANPESEPILESVEATR